MSETIGEMILPGTYIDVRAEGLIGVSGIATGNVGVVGTANRGPLNTIKVLGSYAEALEVFGNYDRWPNPGVTPTTPPLTLTRTLEQVFSGGASSVYAVRVANAQSMASQAWTVNGSGGALFTFTANSPGTWANTIVATLDVDAEPIKLTLEFNRAKETFEGNTALEIATQMSVNSRWVEVGTLPTGPNAAAEPTTVAKSNTPGGPDGASAGGTEVADALAILANENINILVIGGLPAKDIADEVLAHLEATETDGKERIAVLGASADEPSDVIDDDVAAGSSGRLVLVAPGIRDDDAARVGEQIKEVALTPPYAAALVAGRLAGIAPHVSLTNKDVPAGGLTRYYTRAEQKQLLNQRVLVLFRQLGVRVLKGNSTDTGAFKQISVRRIVDFAKEGVRRGSNPYIGKLNNARVRAALKATLDGFLSGMVLDEMLTAYTLDVTATRAQEINGICLVTMTLQPTFSIDFVKVIMTLE